MSGGRFEYAQYRIADIYNEIEYYVFGHELDDEDIKEILEDRWVEDDARKYICDNRHTVPNEYEYSKKTIREFKKAIEILKKAEIYAQRIDWLLSGDDGEDNFHERLKHDLEELKNNKEKST